eukprot:TRINITY_DN16333_c0_g1_i1.p3 TRINITY_DN16333_c0_g1~~TRINITY_DN16333_c0_g1_i1.p3  ORF type:complete len:150 (-),score=19.28 TRINITY_DN16333_c0_g1_i1:581-1030(-)
MTGPMIVHFNLSRQIQAMTTCLKSDDLVPHPRHHPHHKGRLLTFRNYLRGIFPKCPCPCTEVALLVGSLLVALIEGWDGGVADLGVVEGIVVKGEIEGIVVNSLVLVGVLELEVEEDGGVRGGYLGGEIGIGGFVEGWDVEFGDGEFGS